MAASDLKIPAVLLAVLGLLVCARYGNAEPPATPSSAPLTSPSNEPLSDSVRAAGRVLSDAATRGATQAAALLQQHRETVTAELADRMEALRIAGEVWTMPALSRWKVRALIEAADADERLQALLAERHSAARTELTGRWREFQAGRGTLAFLLDASRRTLHAELELGATPADRVAAYQAHWGRLDRICALNEARHTAGRIPTKDFLEGVYQRAAVELCLLRAGVVIGELPLLREDLLDGYSDEQLTLSEGKRVRARLARLPGNAYQSALLRARLGTALYILVSRWKALIAGRGTLEFVLDASQRLLETEADLCRQPGDAIVLLEAHRQRLAGIEKLMKEWYEAERIPVPDFARATCARLEAAVWLELADQAPGSDERLPGLRRARAAAAKTEVDARMAEFRKDRGTLEFLLRACQRLLQAEQELSDRPEDRRAALTRHAQRMAAIERVSQQRYDAGSMPISDLASVRFQRAQAEILLVRAASGR
jgi:hypothetical protein